MYSKAKLGWFACIQTIVAAVPLLLAAPRGMAVGPPGCGYYATITSPANGTKFLTTCSTLTAPVTIAADACTGLENILAVQFYANGVLVGSDDTPPYSIVWNAPAGNHALQARVYNAMGQLVVQSAVVNITVSTLKLLSPAMSGSDFQFTVTGKPGVAAEVQASTDLVNWSTIGTVTLNANGTYSYLDTSVGSLNHRFYRVQQSGSCSCNAIGFVKKALVGNALYSSVANQLNNPGGNNLSVLFASLPQQSEVLIYSSASQTFSTSTKSASGWSANPAVNPGQGAYVRLPSGASAMTVVFVGEVPQGQQVNSDISTTIANYSLINSIVPRAGTIDALGFPKRDGDTLLKYDEATQSYIYLGTWGDNEWFPEVPSLQVGESFWLQSGSSDVRSWTQTFSPCN